MNKLVNKALLVENFKLYWVVPALSILAYLLFMIFPLFAADADQQWGRARVITNIMAMQHPIILISIIAVPAIAVLCVTGQFFSKKRATALYSFPITKNQMFLTNALSGIILTLAPLLIVGLFLLIPIRFPELADNRWLFENSGFRNFFTGADIAPGMLLNPAGQVLALLLRIVITKLFYFGLFMLAFSVAGHKVIAILLAAVMPFVAILAYALYVMLEMFYVFGSAGRTDFTDFFDTVARYSNPVFAWSDSFDAGIHLYFWFATLTIVFFVAAFVINRLRKTERTGDSIMFSPVKNVLVFLVAIAAAIFVVMFASTFFNISAFTANVAFYYVGLMVGFTLGFIIGQMIAEKTLAIGHKLKTFPLFAGVAVVLYVVMLIFTQFVITPVINRLPATDSVAEVWFTHRIPNERERGEMWAQTPLTDQADIQQALDIHGETIDSRPAISGPWQRITTDRIAVTYVLNDGTQIRRVIVASHGFFQARGFWELQETTFPAHWSWTQEEWDEFDRLEQERWEREAEVLP